MPVAATNAPSTATITNVRTSVAKSESTPSRPIFAKMAVSAAKTAEPRAQGSHAEVGAMCQPSPEG